MSCGAPYMYKRGRKGHRTHLLVDVTMWAGSAAQGPPVAGRPPPPSFPSCKRRSHASLVAIVSCATLGCLVFGIVGSLFLRRAAFDENDSRVRTEFEVTSTSLAQILQTSMASSVNTLVLLAATMTVFPNTTFGQFVAMSTSVRAPTLLQAIEWVPRVLPAERQAVEETVSAYVGYNATITVLAANGSLIPAPDAPVYFPIRYVDPLVGNERALLFDPYANPFKFAAEQQAMDTGRPQVGNPFALVQSIGLPGSPTGTTIAAPVYSSGAACAVTAILTVAQREACIYGFVLGVWRYQTVIGSVVERAGHPDTAIQVYDNLAGVVVYQALVENGAVLTSSSPGTDPMPDTTHRISLPISVSERNYTVIVYALPRFTTVLTSNNPANIELALGLLVMAAVLLMVWCGGYCWVEHDRSLSEAAQLHMEKVAVQASKDTNNRIVGYVCHELRNPLHVLETWFEELMGEGVGNVAAWQDIHNALGQMRGIVNDILDYRAIDAGGLSFLPVPVRLQDALMPVVKRGLAYLNPGVQLRAHIPDECVVVDSQRLDQIITNGLSNAGKFTTSGYVDVFVSVTTWSGGSEGPAPSSPRSRAATPLRQQVLCLDISNTGNGLPPHPETLFIPFRGAGLDARHMWASRAREMSEDIAGSLRRVWLDSVGEGARAGAAYRVLEGGSGGLGPVSTSTGLGLPLSREFASVCGGWLGLEDDAQGVTHFWCVVPAPPATPIPSSSPTATDASEVVVAVLPPQVPVEPPPSLPVSCSEGEGKEAGEGEGEQVAPVAPPPRADAVVTVVQAGGHLDPATPVSVMVDSTPLSPLSEFGDLSVVVIDDEKPNLRVAERLLYKAGVGKGRVTLLGTGEEGVAHLRSLPPCARGSPPHTITLLDINLGSMTGLDVMREVGSPPCPVIACTSYVSVEDQEKFKAAGFSGLLGKPFQLRDLQAALRAASVPLSLSQEADRPFFVRV